MGTCGCLLECGNRLSKLLPMMYLVFVLSANKSIEERSFPSSAPSRTEFRVDLTSPWRKLKLVVYLLKPSAELSVDWCCCIFSLVLMQVKEDIYFTPEA